MLLPLSLSGSGSRRVPGSRQESASCWCPGWALPGRGHWPQRSSSPGLLQGPLWARGTRATGRPSLYPPLPTKPPHRPLRVSLGTALSKSLPLPSILETALRGGYCLHTQRGQHLLKCADRLGAEQESGDSAALVGCWTLCIGRSGKLLVLVMPAQGHDGPSGKQAKVGPG